MSVAQVQKQLDAKNAELASFEEHREMTRRAIRAETERAALERHLQRERELEFAIELDPEYPRKLKAAKQAFSDARGAFQRVDAARYERAVKFPAKAPDDGGDGTIVYTAPQAAGRTAIWIPGPTLAEQLAEMAVRQTKARLKALEQWPRKVAQVEQARIDAEASAKRVAEKRARLGIPPDGHKRSGRRVITAIRERLTA